MSEKLSERMFPRQNEGTDSPTSMGRIWKLESVLIKCFDILFPGPPKFDRTITEKTEYAASNLPLHLSGRLEVDAKKIKQLEAERDALLAACEAREMITKAVYMSGDHHALIMYCDWLRHKALALVRGVVFAEECPESERALAFHSKIKGGAECLEQN